MQFIVLISFLIPVLSFGSSADVVSGKCQLSKSLQVPVENLFELWPQSSNVSKKLVIKISENNDYDWLEISVFNKLRGSDNTVGSPGAPSEYIYAMWGTNPKVDPLAVFLSYPGERSSHHFTSTTYLKEIRQTASGTYYKLGHSAQYICHQENRCIQGNKDEYMEILMDRGRILGIELTTSKIADANGIVYWQEIKYCVKNAVLDRVVEHRYNAR